MTDSTVIQPVRQAEPVQPASAWLGFLSPEDVVVWQPPAQLHHRLSRGLTGPDEEAAFVAANRLALEAFRVREAAVAEAVCRMEISYATTLLRHSPRSRTVMLGLQPVVNLIRLNGYTTDLEAARQGLAALETIAASKPVSVLGFDLTPELLAFMGSDTVQVRRFARANCLIETAKILWRRRRHDDMRAECARLMAKWPRCATAGPFHAAEAGWMLGGGPVRGIAEAPALRRIRLLHMTSHAIATDTPLAARIAGELFETRTRACDFRNALSAARDLASLGDSWHRLGDRDRGDTCFAEAWHGAAGTDPALANVIRDRWLRYQTGASASAPELPCPRLAAADLAHLAGLAAARMGT